MTAMPWALPLCAAQLPMLASVEVWVPAATLGGGVASSGASAAVDLVAAALRHAPLLLLVALQLWAAGAGGAAAESAPELAELASDEACSKPLGFNESAVPRDRAFQDLIACDEHHKRTCCERNDTLKVRLLWSNFAVERTSRCSAMAQRAFCSLCDADVGVGIKSAANTILLCPSFCRQWFEACLEDFFAPSSAGGLQGCGPSSVVCSALSEITADPAEFCSSLAGPMGVAFAVAGQELEPEGCFDGLPAARSRGAGPKAFWERPARPTPGFEVYIDALLREAKKYEKHAPAVIIASAMVFFGWYILRGALDT